MKKSSRDKHEAIVSIPEVARVAIVSVEPRLTVIIALHVEHVEVAIRVSNRLHGNDEPFTSGLVSVLETELGADFGRAEFQTKFFGFFVEFVGGGIFVAEQISYF